MMLNTELYTVASGPSASGDLSVPDPSPAQAEQAIAESLMGEDFSCEFFEQFPVKPEPFLGTDLFQASIESIYAGLGIPASMFNLDLVPQETRQEVLKHGWADGATKLPPGEDKYVMPSGDEIMVGEIPTPPAGAPLPYIETVFGCAILDNRRVLLGEL